MVCRNIDNRLKAFAVAFAFMMFAPFCTLLSQHIDKELFQRFEKRFALIDSLIFPQGQPQGTTQGKPQFLFPAVAESMGEDLYDRSVDSLLQEKTDNRKAALKAESGLLVSGLILLKTICISSYRQEFTGVATSPTASFLACSLVTVKLKV